MGDEYEEKLRAFLEGLEADDIDVLMELSVDEIRGVGEDLKNAFVRMAEMSEEVLDLAKKLQDDQNE